MKQECAVEDAVPRKVGVMLVDAGARKALKDVTEIRADNLDALFVGFKEEVWRTFPDEPEKGMLRRFAARAGLTDRYASHLRCRRKGMGHATARKLEENFGLPMGWMDQDHSDPAMTGTVMKASEPGAESIDPGLEKFIQAAQEVYKLAPSKAQAAIMDLLLSHVRGESSRTTEPGKDAPGSVAER